MNDFAALRDEHIRLSILRALVEDEGYSQNESILQEILVRLGLNPSRDKVKTELEWLKEQGLVTLESVFSVKVATITQRGADVARGLAKVPGVKRPSPKG